MSRMMPSGGRRPCTRSIQAPDRSVSAARFASVASHSVSKRPIWLVEAAGRSMTLPADDGAHRRIAGEPLGIVDVFVAGEAAVDRLAQAGRAAGGGCSSHADLGEGRCGHRGQAEHIVQLAVGEQAAVGGDPGPVELELEAAVEGDPERRLLASPVASAINTVDLR